MHIEPLADWQSYCLRAELPSLKILAHPGGKAGAWPAGHDLVAAVGPEGGFTEEEVDLARSTGWQVIDLGPRILALKPRR